MSNDDYGQIRQERIFVTPEDTFNTQKHPAARDVVFLRARATLPSVLTDRVPSEEIRTTPDIDQLLDRKKPPGAFELVFYAKGPDDGGMLPQCAALLRNVMGIEQMVLTVLDYAAIAAMSPPGTITVTVEGVDHVLTEGTDFNAVTSNTQTATNIAAAIAMISGGGIDAEGSSAEVLITRDDGTGDFSVATDIADTDLDLTEIRYLLATDILEKSLTITHSADNVLHHYRGCHASSVVFAVSGSNEGEIRFRGFLGNEVLCGYHTLNGGINNTSDPVTLTFNEALRLLLGPNSTDDIYVQIDSEILRLVPGSENYTNKTVSAARAQAGSTIASHTSGAEVAPYVPGSDPDNNDTIVPMTLGAFVFDGTTHRIAEVSVTDDEKLEPRIDEAFEAALTGYRRPLSGRTVAMQFTAYQRESILQLLPMAQLGTTVDATVTIGRAGYSPQIVLDMPRYQLLRPEKAERSSEFARVFNGMGKASSTPGNDGLSIKFRPV